MDPTKYLDLLVSQKSISRRIVFNLNKYNFKANYASLVVKCLAYHGGPHSDSSGHGRRVPEDAATRHRRHNDRGSVGGRMLVGARVARPGPTTNMYKVKSH